MGLLNLAGTGQFMGGIVVVFVPAGWVARGSRVDVYYREGRNGGVGRCGTISKPGGVGISGNGARSTFGAFTGLVGDRTISN